MIFAAPAGLKPLNDTVAPLGINATASSGVIFRNASISLYSFCSDYSDIPTALRSNINIKNETRHTKASRGWREQMIP
jgi:hypothetical protein